MTTQAIPKLVHEAHLPASLGGNHQDCIICMESLPAELMYTIGSCLHRFCYNCLKCYVLERVTCRLFPMACPHPGCKAAISMPECQLLVQSSEANGLLAEVRLPQYHKASPFMLVAKAQQASKILWAKQQELPGTSFRALLLTLPEHAARMEAPLCCGAHSSSTGYECML